MTFFKVAQAKLPPLNIATLHGHYKHILSQQLITKSVTFLS